MMMTKAPDRFTVADRAMLLELRDMVRELREMLQTEGAEIRRRLDVLERPRIARVVVDPSRPTGQGNGP
jgi:hypothetical protein